MKKYDRQKYHALYRAGIFGFLLGKEVVLAFLTLFTWPGFLAILDVKGIVNIIQPSNTAKAYSRTGIKTNVKLQTSAKTSCTTKWR